MPRGLQRFVVWLAFAGAMLLPLLVPAIAHAALLPTCDSHDAVTRLPVEWLPKAAAPAGVEATDACSSAGDAVAAVADEPSDDRVAAMCDDRGACVIAPPRVFAVADASIEAAPKGLTIDVAGPVIGPGPEDSPASAPSPALAEHAVIAGGPLVAAASSELAPPFVPPAGGPREGVMRRIDHPPR